MSFELQTLTLFFSLLFLFVFVCAEIVVLLKLTIPLVDILSSMAFIKQKPTSLGTFFSSYSCYYFEQRGKPFFEQRGNFYGSLSHKV